LNPRASTRETLARAATFLAGDSVAALANAATFAVLLRRMDPAAYGYFALSYSLSAWVLPLVQMGMTLSGARRIAERPEEAGAVARTVVNVRAAVGLAAALAMAAAAWWTDPTLGRVLLAWGPAYVLTGLQLEFVCVGLEAPAVLARSRAIATLTYLVGALLFITRSQPPWIVPLLSASGLLLGALFQYRALRATLRAPGPRSVPRWPLVRDGIATTSAQVVQMGYYNVDVPLLRFAFAADVRSIGEYAAATRLLQLAAMPMVALLYAVAPAYSRRAGGAEGDFRARTRTFRVACLALGLAGAVGLAFVGPAFLETLGARPMPVAREVLGILGLAYFLVGLHSPFSAVLTYLGDAGSYLRVNLVAFLVTLALDLVLIPRWGFAGAAVSLAVGVASLLPTGWRAYQRRVEAAAAA